MATVLVWSERPEPNASGLRDCTYSAGLMGMVHGGWTAFPKGIYTVAEREALERSDDQPNETGASLDDLILALKRRYKVTKTKNSAAALPGLLTKKGIGLVVQGKNGNLPSGHVLRRWDPGFTGGHAVYVVPDGTGFVQWLDPEATNKYKGDRVAVAVVLKWAAGLGGSITFKNDEFKPVVVTPPQPPVTPTSITLTPAELQAKLDAAMTAGAASRDAEVATLNGKINSLTTQLAAAEGKIAAIRTALG